MTKRSYNPEPIVEGMDSRHERVLNIAFLLLLVGFVGILISIPFPQLGIAFSILYFSALVVYLLTYLDVIVGESDTDKIEAARESPGSIALVDYVAVAGEYFRVDRDDYNGETYFVKVDQIPDEYWNRWEGKHE